jgi:hypothetical protein
MFGMGHRKRLVSAGQLVAWMPRSIYIYNSKFSPRLESATNTASVFADASFFGRVSTKTVGGLMQELDRGKGCRVGMRWDL